MSEHQQTCVHFPRITHIAMHVEDIDATIDFYSSYCGMVITHSRESGEQRIVWMAEPGRERDLIIVMMNGGRNLNLPDDDYRHIGFAVASKQAVDAISERARANGQLVWEPRQEPYPVGYYCGLKDPNGNYVEFSYGQPLGPGAAEE